MFFYGAEAKPRRCAVRTRIPASCVMAGFIFMATQAFPADDVCVAGTHMLMRTNTEAYEIFTDRIEDKEMEGQGRVINVSPGYSDDESVVRVDCGNNVILEVIGRTDPLETFNIGDRVSFSGKCSHWRRPYYDSMDTTQVLIVMEYATISRR
jgi:hypothetical protein